MSETPLIIISSDRPKNSIDKGENQTIYQDNIYGKYALSFTSINLEKDNLESIGDKINNAFYASLGICDGQKISQKFRQPI